MRDKILRSDALIGFTTRRTTQDNVNWQTHRWVVEELAAANALGKRTVEVRETGVDNQGGLTENNQRIDYDEAKRDECVVEIAEAVGVWTSRDFVRVQLLPPDVYNDLLPFLEQQGLTCQYTVKTGNFEDAPVAASIDPIKGGLFVAVPKGGRDALFRIKIRYGSRVWFSDYESFNSHKIELRAAGGGN